MPPRVHGWPHAVWRRAQEDEVAKRSRWLALVGAGVIAMVGAACGDDDGGSDGAMPGPTGAGTVAERTIEHAAGTTTISGTPQRIVALDEHAALDVVGLGGAPTTVYGGFRSGVGTDILNGLGFEVEPYALTAPDLEAVAAARPDLILGSGHPGTVSAFGDYSQIAPTVVVPIDASWHEQLDVVAAALDREEEATAFAGALEERITELASELEEAGRTGDSVAVVGGIRGGPFAFPASGLPGRLLADLGLTRPPAEDVTVPPEQGFVMFSAETLADHDADVIITVDGDVFDTETTILESPLFASLAAVAEGEVYAVAGDMWLAGSPFTAAWIVDDLAAILVDGQDPEADPAARWGAVVMAGSP
jgi:iron complex transport system substrate-binding protein